MNPFSQLNPLRVRPAAILLALALILGGLVSLTSSTATATSPAGLFLGKYGQDSVLTTNSALPACDADPAVQVSATIDPVAAVTLSNGEYYGFVESLTSTTEFVLRHYDSAGTEINTVSSFGTVRGLHATGFIYEYTDGATQQKLFFSNTGPIALEQITFVPGSALNECIASESISNSTKAATYAYFKPSVSTVSPAKGSTAGGTTATINGSGFVPSYTSVRIGDVAATITTMTRTSITISTGPQTASAGAYRVAVKVGPIESTETVNFTYETPLCPGVAKARSKFVSDNLFLGGSHIELGISPLGNFGTSATKPAEFFGTTSSQIGMSVDYDGFDCGPNNTSIDFFLPGTPEERFAVGAKIDGSNTALYMGVSDLNSIVASGIGGDRAAMISRTVITNLSTGTTLRAKVVSKFVTSTNADLMTVTQDISFTEDAMYFSNLVTIKNDNTKSLTSARYMRSFDPDNTQFRGGPYATENEIIAQYATHSYSAVRAKTYSDSDPLYVLFGTRAPILFYSSDSLAKAGSFGFANSNPYESGAYDSPANTGVFVQQDAGITMTMEFGSLTPGQEKSKMYITSLDLRDFSALETELEELVATVEARVAVETGSASTETVTRPSSGSGGFASLTPLPTVTPTPTPTPTRRPPAPSSPRPTVPLPVATSAPVALPAPLGPVVLIPELEVRPNIAFTPSNPVPAEIREVLSKPFGYQLDAAGKPELPALAPTQSLAFENGSPVGVELVPTEEQSGYILSGDGWQVELAATDMSGSPLKLDDSGNIILNDDRFVEFSGTGFAPGSIVKVWLFSDPAELSQLTADSSGSFTGRAMVPIETAVGEHTIQLNGISKDGQLRSVALGVVVQADALLETSQFDWSWWYLLGGLLPFFWWILWKRRRREEEEDSAKVSA
jgi:hypothetical protein